MKIYVCENYHDNDCGIFIEKEAALNHLDKRDGCEVQEYELVRDRFERAGDPIRNCSCSNCGKQWRSDKFTGPTWKYEDFCSEECRLETDQFYSSGNTGIHGLTTRQMKERIKAAMMAGTDPLEGCHSTGSGPKPNRIEATKAIQ